jgi:hypothetical protein
MLSAQSLVAKSTVAILPFAYEIQYLIFEYIYGTADYRAHYERLSEAQQEAISRTAFKLKLREKSAELRRMLVVMQHFNLVDRFTATRLDLRAHEHGWKPVFLSNDASIVYNITWTSPPPEPAVMAGPAAIVVTPRSDGTLSFMTINFFPPTDEEVRERTRSSATTVRFHTDIEVFKRELTYRICGRVPA